MDIEVYRNYFLVQFKALDSLKVRSFEMYDGQALDRETLIAILKTYTIITFNGMDYDMPILMYALKGATCAELKKASDHIIVGQLRGWQFEQEYSVKVPPFIDHIDLKEAVPGVQISLKMYGGRLHSRRLQDLPYDPDMVIGPTERETPKGWAYEYYYPQGCIKALEIARDSDLQKEIPFQTALRYDQETGAESRVIWTDEPNAQLLFVRDVQNTTVFTPLFDLTLSYFMGIPLSRVMAKNTRTPAEMSQLFQFHLGEAIRSGEAEAQDKEEQDAEWIKDR